MKVLGILLVLAGGTLCLGGALLANRLFYGSDSAEVLVKACGAAISVIGFVIIMENF